MAQARRATELPHGSQRRADVQGLRALAVSLVVAYHAGLPVVGGYLGVDLFFVISGYVITGVLIRELDSTGRVDFARFYLRRAKRLVPALGLVISVTMVASAVLLSPMGMQQIAAKTGLGALAMAANWVIQGANEGYFDLPAQQNPLLHTWSLSVEEQFYFVFPISALIAWRLRRLPGIFRLAIAVLLLSLTLTIWSEYFVAAGAKSWLAGFYGPLARAFEFAAGVVAYYVSRNAMGSAWSGSRRAKWLEVFAWGTLAVAIQVAGTAAQGSIPARCMTVLATACLLLPRAPNATAQRALSSAPMQLVGDASYALYLWHWPAIVLGTYLWPLDSRAAAKAAAVSVPIALAAYYFVEQPIRRSSSWSLRRWMAAGLAFQLLPLGLATTVGLLAKEVWFPLYESGRIVGKLEGDVGARSFVDLVSSRARPCTEMPRLDAELGGRTCAEIGPDGPASVLILGDSHGSNLMPGLASAVPEVTFRYAYTTSLRERVAEQEAQTVELLEAMPNLKVVLLNSYWASANDFGDDLRRFIAHLTGRGLRVLVLDDAPDFPFDAFTCKYGLSPVVTVTRCDQPRSAFDVRYRSYYGDLRVAVAGNEGARLLKTAHTFCQMSTCSMSDGRNILYLDSNHLNLVGSERIGRLIRPTLLEELRLAGAA